MEKKIYTSDVVVGEKTFADICRALKHKDAMGEGDTIGVTANFPDGRIIDIKCCGAQDEPAWTEAVLFEPGKNGTYSEVCCSEVSDEFLGEWTLETEDAVYTANVVRALPKEAYVLTMNVYGKETTLPDVSKEAAYNTAKKKILGVFNRFGNVKFRRISKNSNVRPLVAWWDLNNRREGDSIEDYAGYAASWLFGNAGVEIIADLNNMTVKDRAEFKLTKIKF